MGAGDYTLSLAVADSNCENKVLNLPSIRLGKGEVVDLYVIGDITNQPLQIASTTGFTEIPGPVVKARIMIVKDAVPHSKRNFRFGGDLGDFKLDDPAPMTATTSAARRVSASTLASQRG